MTKLLPPPNLGRLLSRTRPSAALLALCDFAEVHVWEENPGNIPWKFCPRGKGKVIQSVWAKLYVKLDFYVRWKNIPKEEDIPTYFPKGIGVLVESSRREVLHTIEIIRGEKWTSYIEEEYEAAFDRCAKSCAAVRLGHWPGPNNPIVFSREDVEKTMLHSKEGEVGVVDFGHIYRVLLSQAQLE